MENNKLTSRPPYPSTGQADAILDIFKRISPKKIDSKFVFENNIATAPNASSVVNFVKWLGIIDSENNVKEEIASKLKLIGEEGNKYIAELIKQAYKEVLEGVNLQQARREDLVNFFIHNYGYGIAPARTAAILLLHLCEKYGIPISDELKKKTHREGTGTSRPEKKLKSKVSKNVYDKISTSYITKPEEGIVILCIKGNGLDKQIEARTPEELQAVYSNEFKSFIEAAKHLFPKKPIKKDDVKN